MASPAQEARNARARSRGFRSYAAERKAREDVREVLEPRGVEMTPDQVLAAAQFDRDYDRGSMTRDQLRDVFFDTFPDADDDDFYAWLDEVSGDQPT